MPHHTSETQIQQSCRHIRYFYPLLPPSSINIATTARSLALSSAPKADVYLGKSCEQNKATIQRAKIKSRLKNSAQATQPRSPHPSRPLLPVRKGPDAPRSALREAARPDPATSTPPRRAEPPASRRIPRLPPPFRRILSNPRLSLRPSLRVAAGRSFSLFSSAPPRPPCRSAAILHAGRARRCALWAGAVEPRADAAARAATAAGADGIAEDRGSPGRGGRSLRSSSARGAPCALRPPVPAPVRPLLLALTRAPSKTGALPCRAG